MQFNATDEKSWLVRDYGPAMPNRSDITDATDEEVLLSLSCALHHDGRKRFQHADDIKARLVAEHLLNHLKRSNYMTRS